MNVGLPLASKVLKTKLSREGLQLDMSMRMLCTHREELGQKERSRLLACKFFTYDFLLKFARRAHNYSVGLPEVTEIFTHSLDSYNVDENPKLYTFHPSYHRSMTLKDVQHHKWCPQGLIGLHIPEKLLHGPWTSEKKQFFNCLIEAHCTIDPNSTAPEVALVEVFEALREGEHDIVRKFVSHESGKGLVPVTHDLFRCAVLEGWCDQETIHTLLYSHNIEGGASRGERTGGLDFLDEDLWAWIEKERMSGNQAKADWLQEVLESQGESIS
jgi:hypothetical protein